MDGDYSEDEWGFDEDFAELVEPLFAFLYETWWRVKVEGAERVPAHGRVLLTSNHAGILPWDATMISLALLREHPLPRHPRFLVLDWAFDLPVDLGGDTQGRRRGGVALQRAAAARAGPAGGRLPRGREGHGQAVLGALPAPALRPRRLRGDRAAHRRADRAGGGGRERGDLPEARRRARRWRACSARRSSRSRRPSRWLGPLGSGAAAVEVADRVPASRSRPLPTGQRPPTTARWSSSSPSASEARFSRPCTRTS